MRDASTTNKMNNKQNKSYKLTNKTREEIVYNIYMVINCDN